MDNQSWTALRIGVLDMEKTSKAKDAQSTLEFTFGMICAVLLIWGMIRIFVWVGGDLFLRRQAHEDALLRDPGCTDSACPLKQIRPSFMESTHLQSVAVNSSIFGE